MADGQDRTVTLPFLRVDPVKNDLTLVVLDVRLKERDRGASEALLQLRRAITQWVRGSRSGMDAFEESAFDFNIGDLVNCLGDLHLTRWLRTYGIEHIEVLYAGSFSPYVEFDLQLVDPGLVVS